MPPPSAPPRRPDDYVLWWRERAGLYESHVCTLADAALAEQAILDLGARPLAFEGRAQPINTPAYWQQWPEESGDYSVVDGRGHTVARFLTVVLDDE